MKKKVRTRVSLFGCSDCNWSLDSGIQCHICKKKPELINPPLHNAVSILNKNEYGTNFKKLTSK